MGDDDVAPPGAVIEALVDEEFFVARGSPRPASDLHATVLIRAALGTGLELPAIASEIVVNRPVSTRHLVAALAELRTA